MCLLAICVSSLEKCLFRSSVYIMIRLLFLILCCISCLYILEIKTLLIALFANIFSHSEGCLFVLFMISFSVQQILSLIRSYLFIFAFFSNSRGEIQKCCWDLCQSLFSSRSFIILGFAFRSLIHFEVFFFFFCICVKEYSNFILLPVAVHYSQQLLLKRLSSLLCCN